MVYKAKKEKGNLVLKHKVGNSEDLERLDHIVFIVLLYHLKLRKTKLGFVSCLVGDWFAYKAVIFMSYVNWFW